MKISKRLAALSTAAMLLNTTSAVLCSSGMSFSLATSAAEVHNPVIWSDVPDNDVIRVGDTYYMVSTTMFFSPGAPIMKSKDLVSWEICNYVYDTMADGDVQNLTNGKHDYSHGQWAASLRYNNGHFYVFFGSYGTGKSYIYTTDDIENGEWTRSEINGMYHDASILFDDDGRNYLVYGGGGEIKIKELNSEMTGFKWGGTEKTLFKTGLTGLAGEGSHIQKIGDYYYVFIIAWPNGSGRIEICYRSKELLGNYESKTVLNSGVGSYGSGAAQGGIVDTPDGKWYGMLFQDHGAVGRIPVLVPVTWENDWPIMGVNGKAPVTFEIDGDIAGTSLAVSDDFSYDSDKLKLEWQWNHNPDNKSWSVTERSGWLRLHNNNKATDLLNARNTLTMRTEGPACSSIVKMDASGLKPGDHAGLSAFQFNYGNIGVYVDGNGNKKVYMAKNGGYSGNSAITDSREKIIEEVPLNGDEIYLKVDFKFNDIKSDMSSSNNIDKANFYYSYNGSDWTKLGEELGMTYDLKMFTGYRSAIYSFATSNTGGHADFDFFDYSRTEWNAPTVIVPDENGFYFRSSFESGTEKWTGRGPAAVAVSDIASFSGQKALAVTERTSAWNGTSLPLSSAFRPGETYSFSTNICYTEGPSSELFHLTLQYNDSEDVAHYEKIASGTAVKGKWIQLANKEFTIPQDASDLYIYAETDSGTCDFFIDDAVGAQAGTEIEGAGPAPVIIMGDINGDGKINTFDLVSARHGLTDGFEDDYEKISADTDRDGEVNINDLVLLNGYVLGKTTTFPDFTTETE